jgi:nanoRNase/pAp phosphatase (c-di-AMP/oligoRNAs hydrolase)
MVSVPKGGTPETLENSVRLLYNATTSVNFVEAPEDVTAANMADYLNTLRNIPTTEASIISVAQKKIRGLDLQLDESVKFVEQNDGERMRALRAVFLKNNRVYLVFYMLPESKWQENKKLAEVIINSIR